MSSISKLTVAPFTQLNKFILDLIILKSHYYLFLFHTLKGMSFAGVFGSFLIAWILRRFHNHLMMQKVVIIVTAAACIWCLGVNKPGDVPLIVAAWILYGFISGPLTPITLEHAAEITYPIPADNSAALLFTGVNLVFLAVTLGVTPLLTNDVSMFCESIVSPSSALMMFFVIIGSFVVLPMTAEFKRMAITVSSRDLKEVTMEAGIKMGMEKVTFSD
jgi:MFS family permease